MSGQAWRGDERRGILLDVVVAGQPLEPAADGGERTSGGGFGESAIVERAEIGTDVRVLDAGDGEAGMMTGEPCGEAMQLAAIGAQGVGRGAALGGEDVEVGVDQAAVLERAGEGTVDGAGRGRDGGRRLRSWGFLAGVARHID